jgi:hypothetical protein
VQQGQQDESRGGRSAEGGQQREVSRGRVAEVAHKRESHPEGVQQRKSIKGIAAEEER